MKEKISITLNSKIIKEADSLVDYITIRNRSQAIEYLINKSLGQQKNAVILGGGNAASFKVSDAYYRCTVPVNGVPLVERNVRKLKENGFRNIYFVGEPALLSAVFNILQEGTKYGVHVTYIEDTNAHGSMDTLRRIRGKIGTHFLVVYHDIYFTKISIDALWNDHLMNHGTATLMLTTAPEPSKKGIVKMEGNRVLDFVQKPKKSDVYLGFSSMFIAEPEIFEYSGHSLEEDIFPQLAKASLLFGHLSSEKEAHIHTMKDVERIGKNVKGY